MTDVAAPVAWLEAVGLIRRTGERWKGRPVFIPIALPPGARAEVAERLAARLRARGDAGDHASLLPYVPPREWRPRSRR
jgi:hypothetical protein